MAKARSCELENGLGSIRSWSVNPRIQTVDGARFVGYLGRRVMKSWRLGCCFYFSGERLKPWK